MTGPLTTNDVRVLRLLAEQGPLTVREIEWQLRRSRAGAEPALRRLLPLRERGLCRLARASNLRKPIDITPDGVRALRAADLADYGAFA